ncbi:MAG: hypothetical protein KDK24_00670 [Pseudooceanicola sp.]|nr:hypothetical protein [Pseudooceanicola sp.]
MTGFLRPLLVAVLSLVALPAPAQPTRWAMVGEWNISYYPATGGCLAYTLWDRTAMFIGFDTREGLRALDVTLLDERWKSIEPGVVYPVGVRFGRRPAWTLDMTGVVMDGAPGLNILVNAERDKAQQLLAEFRRELRMTWTYDGTELGRFPLHGSRRAFDAVLECQRHHDRLIALFP